MVASTIDGRPPRSSPIQGWARRSRSGPQPIHGQKGYPAPAFFAELIDSLVPRKATGSATFTRATTAYVSAVSATGNAADGEILILCASGEARFSGARRVSEGVWSRNYADGTAIPNANLKGYLAEGARTNLILRSQEHDVNGLGTPWAVDGVTISADSVAAPDGTTTADKYVETATSAVHRNYQFTTNGDATYTFSVYAKAGERTKGFVVMSDNTTGGVGAYFDLSAVTVAADTQGAGSWTSVSRSIAAVGNSGWYRITITATRGAGTQTLCILHASDGSSTSSLSTYAGDAAKGLYFWGAQLEAASFASSYIPTTTIAVARNADALSWPTAGNQSDTAGVAYAEITYTDWANATGQTIGDGTEYPLAPVSNTSGVKAYDGTNTVTGAAGSPSGTVKQASRWSGSALKCYANGTGGTAGSYDGTFSLSSIGIGNGGTFAPIKNVRIWTTALSDAQIAAI